MSTSATSTARTKVLLVDDHDLIRRGLRHAFERDRQFEVVGEASTAAEAIRQAGALQPDVVIMDPRLPDGSGLEATRPLRKTSAPAGIAKQLFVSESTAKTHISKLYEKLGAADRAQALMTALRLGLLEAPDAPKF